MLENKTSVTSLKSLLWANSVILFLSFIKYMRVLTRYLVPTHIQFLSYRKINSLIHKLISPSALRFIKRYTKNRQESATSLGFRAANFYIDHDPLRSIHHALPTSLTQIRAEEIHRRINDLLNNSLIHQYTLGAQIFGVLDPEQCLTSCCDTLKLFSCLYLDAGPVVERRLKGLTGLLPIIEPDLADYLVKIPNHDLIRRNQWFFFCDFSWVDQQIFETSNKAFYEVNMSQFIYSAKDILSDNLKTKSIDLSNCVWIGLAARERLIQECSYLQEVLEPHPIFDPIKQEEHIFFCITFDQLIPRLQMYEELDQFREKFVDFEPSLERLSILDLLEKKSTSHLSYIKVIEVLTTIRGIEWQGFKEKDLALQTIIKLYHNTNEQLNNGLAISRAETPDSKRLYQEFLHTVKTVGYPSQTLHKALLNKQNFRQIKNLLTIAQDDHHPLFQDAWSLLTDINLNNTQHQQIIELTQLIEQTSGKSHLKSSQFIQTKAIQVSLNLVRHQATLHAQHKERLPIDLISIMHEWLISYCNNLEVWKNFISGVIYLEKNYQDRNFITQYQIRNIEKKWRKDLPNDHLPFAFAERLSEAKNILSSKNKITRASA